jgi:MinD-like ATPase involved in chromosome partitioning or flagellar assembly
MTALDQAFLKAYAAQPPLRAPAAAAVEQELPAAQPLIASTAKPQNNSAPRPHFDIRHVVKPLAAYVPAAEEAASFSPGLEIDSVTWPGVLQNLPKAAAAAAQVCAEQILAQADLSRKLIAITGCQRGEGRTTILSAIARDLCKQCKLAIVDCDWQHPELATELGIAAQQGLEQVLDGDSCLADVSIASAREGMLIVPTCGRVNVQSRLAMNLRGSVALGTLRDLADAVLLDVGPADEPHFDDVTSWCNAIRVDAVYVVCNRTTQTLDDAYAVCRKLVDAGIVVAGIIENHSAAKAIAAELRLAVVQ